MRGLALVVLLGLTVAACGAPPEGEVRIGFVPKSLNQEFWVNTKKGAEAAQRDNVKVLTKAAGADTQIMEQIDLVENLLAQDVDALVVAPSDSNLPKPVLEKPAQRMPVVLFDSDIPGWKPKTAYVGTENEVGSRRPGATSPGC
jgi:ribose transport system substrate-binding protein